MALKRVVVFGGNGFVGSAVLQRLAGVAGVEAVSVSRSGAAPAHAATWGDAVDWRAGDALDAATFGDALDGAAAVVASVGTPPLPGADRRDNGDTVRGVLAAAAAAGVPRAVVVGATMPPWLGSLSAGYAAGKRDAEAAAEAFAAPEGRGAVVVKPTAVYGTRHTKGGAPIPLWLALAPVSHGLRAAKPLCDRLAALAPGAFAGLLDPPVPVDAVAAAVVDGCFSDAYRDAFAVLGPDDILARAP